MKKVLLFGGTGNLGKKIAEEQSGFKLTAVVRNEPLGQYKFSTSLA